MVLKSWGDGRPAVASSGNGNRYMFFLGIPDFAAASTAKGNKGTHVNKAFDPDDFN